MIVMGDGLDDDVTPIMEYISDKPEEREEKSDLDTLLESVPIQKKEVPPEAKPPVKKKTTTKRKTTRKGKNWFTKYKPKFKDPMKVFNECKEGKLATSIDTAIANNTSLALGINMKRDEVLIATSAEYCLRYYGVELPIDHPIVIISYAAGVFGSSVIDKLQAKKNLLKTKPEDIPPEAQ